MGILTSMIDLDFFRWKNECICVYMQKFNFTSLRILCSYYIENCSMSLSIYCLIFEMSCDVYDVKMWSYNVKMPSHDVIFSKSYFKAFVTDFCCFGEYFRWFVCFAHQGSHHLCCFLISICSVTILQLTNSCGSLFNRYSL